MPVSIIYTKDKVISSTVRLPASKSISNRALIIKAIGNLDSNILNLSEAQDTVVLQKVLAAPQDEIFAGEGGTTLRFLIAYLCLIGRRAEVTAAPSLMHRPVSELLEALRSLGAKFDFHNKENQLPFCVLPSPMAGGVIKVDGNTSSQFISALMMIAPYLKGGLVIEVSGEPVSWPYVLMTGKVMSHFGVIPEFNKNTITIHESVYQPSDISIEADWSAASFWYEIAALSKECRIELPGLWQDSWQGDAVIAELLTSFGVQTEFTEKGVVVTKKPGLPVPEYFKCDLSGCPDLGLPLAALCGGLNITADLEQLVNFRLKESDRAVAMQRGLYDHNVKTDFCGGSKFKIYPGIGIQSGNRIIKSYNDHRVAMAFSPLAILTGRIVIDEPEVVSKSYPAFFNDLNAAGFEIKFD